MSGIGDKARAIVREEIVLNKFEGPEDDGIIVETVYIVNGNIEKHEFFEDGELVKTETGGNSNPTN